MLKNLALACAVAGFALLASPATAVQSPYTSAALTQLLSDRQPVAVDFHADWCPTCRAQAPILKSLASEPEFRNLTILVADFDTALALRKQLHVDQQSTIVVFRDGKEIARATGATDKAQLAALLRRAL